MRSYDQYRLTRCLPVPAGAGNGRRVEHGSDTGGRDLARSLALTAARLGDPQAQKLDAVAQHLAERRQQRRALRRRHRLHPNDTQATLQLARIELAAGQAREADDLADQVLRADVDNRAALDLKHQILQPAAP